MTSLPLPLEFCCVLLLVLLGQTRVSAGLPTATTWLRHRFLLVRVIISIRVVLGWCRSSVIRRAHFRVCGCVVRGV
jgi:hypothetical protein